MSVLRVPGRGMTKEECDKAEAVSGEILKFAYEKIGLPDSGSLDDFQDWAAIAGCESGIALAANICAVQSGQSGNLSFIGRLIDAARDAILEEMQAMRAEYTERN